MIKIWSELPGARLKEQVADLATIAWVVFWGSIVWGLFDFLVGFTTAGRAVRDGGNAMVEGGQNVGESLSGLPLIGAQVGDLATGAFEGVGRPIASFGTEIEEFVVVVSVVLAALLALVTIAPWLYRYVPWRIERLRRVRAAHQAIRRAPDVGEATLQRTLAMRAISRLEYETLLDYTPDPVGDWTIGRHDRLARAEMESVGLRP
jgi:hypothetical protein